MTDTLINKSNKEVVHKNVFVLGAGWTGTKAALELAEENYNVFLVAEESSLDDSRAKANALAPMNEEQKKVLEDLDQALTKSSRVQVWTESKLISLFGVPGNFQLRFARNQEITTEKAGAIIVATDLSPKPLYEKYGLTPSKKVLSQTEMESLLVSNSVKEKTVAFLVGFGQEGNPLTMERIMQSVNQVEKQGGQAYVFVNNIKVAAEGLERLYKENRNQGAIYFKLREQPEASSDGSSIKSLDQVTGKTLELEPDLVVVEEKLQAHHLNSDLSEILRLETGPWNFLQENNVHRFPVSSNRAGIYVIGGSRDVFGLPLCWTDAANAALEVKTFLEGLEQVQPKPKAVIDKEKCCFCLTCYRSCPHGAIYWEDKPVISELACQACGNCASECPQEAIQIYGYQDDEIKQQIQKALKEASGTDPRIIAFCCENSAYEAAEMASEFGRKLPNGLSLIKVPCAGKIDIDYIFSAFIHGADGVLIATCHPENCKSVHGNTFAGWRTERAKDVLSEAGLEKDRLVYSTFASNMDHDFSRTALELEEYIKKTGINPLRKN